MDTKSQITDLPEPKPTIRTLTEDTQRQWRLFIVFIRFVTFYACIHKLFIPLCLSFTRLKGSPYSEIQVSLVLPLALTFLSRQIKQLTPAFCFLCGMAISFGLIEVYFVSIGRHVGWFGFSRLLSSVPMAIACGFAMTKPSFKPQFKFTWAGAITLVLLTLSYEMYFLNNPSTTPQNNPTQETRLIPSNEHLDCGAQALEVSKGNSSNSSSLLEINECGFKPPIYTLPNGQLTVQNNTQRPVNIHLLVFEREKKRTLWNVVLQPKEQRNFNAIVISSNSIGMLYSDSAPEFGLSAVRNNLSNHAWSLSRKPIKAMEISAEK